MEMTIRELLETTNINYPHREAFVFKDSRATYAEFYAKVNQKANELLKIGIDLNLKRNTQLKTFFLFTLISQEMIKFDSLLK